MLAAIDHAELIVRDLDESVEFYSSLGLQVIRRTDHHAGSVEMKLPGPFQFILEMHAPELEENIGVNHIAYRVDDIDAAIEAVVNAGARLDKGPVFFKPTGRTLANFRDPDGWRLQLVARGPDAGEASEAGPSGPVQRLDHLDLYTRDLAGAVKFYREIGLELVNEMNHLGCETAVFRLTGDPETLLDIHQIGTNHVVGFNHFGFAVSDINETHELLRSRGYRTDAPEPVYSKSTKRTVITARDPSGIRVQFSTRDDA